FDFLEDDLLQRLGDDEPSCPSPGLRIANPGTVATIPPNSDSILVFPVHSCGRPFPGSFVVDYLDGANGSPRGANCLGFDVGHLQVSKSHSTCVTYILSIRMFTT